MNEDAFQFYSCVIQVELTGRHAHTLREFVKQLSEVPDGCIYHHLHHSFLRHDLADTPDYTNDFSNWVMGEVEDRVLAEKLANVAPFEFVSIGALRAHLIHVVEEHLASRPLTATAFEFEPFYFDSATTLVFADEKASTLAEFKQYLKACDPSSIYFHWFESRMRRGQKTDDFSDWFERVLGLPRLGAAVRSVDPYMHSLGQLRELLMRLIEVHGGGAV